LGIVVASVVTGGWLAWGGNEAHWVVLMLGLPMAVVGLLADVRHLSIKIRLGVQVAVIAGFLMLSGNWPEIGLPAGMALQGWILLGLVLFVGVWWVNLFNFMDGIDGIAAVQAICMLLSGAGLAWWGDPGIVHDPAWIFSLCIAAATFGFLLINWPPARIFMGDVGSTWLGFMIFAVAMLSIQAGWLSYSAWLVLAAVFMTDATVTLITRMGRGERWYEAHRSHAYQRLSRRGCVGREVGHRSVTLLVLVVNLLWLGPLAWACLQWPQWSLVFAGLAYMPLVTVAIRLGAGKPGDIPSKAG
jgi:Fuc2NAc and GlcNAc transferase